ncbi:hypothetical protein GJ496_000925 [Pomphorhynchus laevis]|nr:hypothetical protein GJ496_000925 [Pomphorhynchus laevis]
MSASLFQKNTDKDLHTAQEDVRKLIKEENNIKTIEQARSIKTYLKILDINARIRSRARLQVAHELLVSISLVTGYSDQDLSSHI